MSQQQISHFVVSLQDSAWQYSHRGGVTGPFASKEQAVTAALAEARALSASGDPSEVIVENEWREFETAWRAEGAMPADLNGFRTINGNISSLSEDDDHER